jgi:hypothetical protein
MEPKVIAIARPEPGEYNPMFQRYVDRVPDADVLVALEAQVDDVTRALRGANERHRYAPGKWSVREVVGHVVDTERMFGYRLLCLARGDKQNLPSFDEDEYAAASGHDNIPLSDLVGQFELVRTSHVRLARNLDDAAWAREGTANGKRMTVRAMPFVMVGHVRHHLAVLAEKYGV